MTKIGVFHKGKLSKLTEVGLSN